jgi:hypothetical protein
MPKARTFVPLALAITATTCLVMVEVASATHARPNSALKLQLAMVPAFKPCGPGGATPNRQHGPPLASPSCSPPVQTSDSVTPGGTSTGVVSIKVQPGNPAPPDDSDVALYANATDIRCRPAALPAVCSNTNTNGAPDYTGDMEGNATIRISDHWNAVAPGGGPDAATVVDLPFPVLGTCTATASQTVGATCGVTTTANAVIGGPDPVVKDNKRAVVEVTQVQITDGGADGQISTLTDNDLFAVQGIFIP